ncbi:MAG TPA: hypothetical protein VK904_07400 [Miltoncostaeaceae bacterium]|nr:hypothetical protein [Miltoncostaeaceae bacterium]
MRPPRAIRNVDAGDLIEMMLVVAVATIIIIRIILELSGYPKLGGGGLHIAHVLYGGLLMIVALIIVFALLNMSARWAAAFIGGVGFGFFIDEVGKFISNDVNYFFEPAFSVMYVVFILLFLTLWAIRRARLGPHDALANALSLLREERDGALDAETKREILSLLDRANPEDPLVPVLRDRVRDTPALERRNFTPYALWRTRLAEWYQRKAETSWFSTLVLVIMIVYGLGSLGTVVSPFTDGRGVDGQNEDFATWFETGSAGVTAILIAVGLAVRHRSRVASYRWFKAAILVSLLITQVFVFYYDQFSALVGVIVSLLLYIALSYMIAREEARERGLTLTPSPHPDPALTPEAT